MIGNAFRWQNAVRGLWFLTFRTTINSIRRSWSLPRRQAGVVITLGVIILAAISRVVSLFFSSGYSNQSISFPLRGSPLPDNWPDILRNVAFFLFAVPFVVILFAGLTVPAVYKKADADVLFATPVPPRMLLFLLIFRSSWKPILWGSISLITYLAQRRALFEPLTQDRLSIALIGQFGFYFSLSYLLSMLAWRTLQLSIALTVNRDGLRYERMMPRLMIAGLIPILCLIGLSGLFLNDSTREFAGQIVASREIRFIIFPGTFGLWIVTGIPMRHPEAFAAGLLGYLAMIGGFGYLMLTRAGWLTDIVARQVLIAGGNGQETIPANPSANIAAERKHWWRRWVRAKIWPGIGAIWWRSLLMFPALWIGYAVILIFVWGVAMFFPVKEVFPKIVTAFGYPAFAFIVTPQLSPAGQILKRIDLIRPLPFRSRTILLTEISVRALPAAVFLMLLNWELLALGVYNFNVATVIAPLFLAVVAIWNAITSLNLSYFPDIEDKTQLMIRALCHLFLAASTLGALFGLFFLLTNLTHQQIAVAWTISLLAIGLCWLAATPIARRFDGINPAE